MLRAFLPLLLLGLIAGPLAAQPADRIFLGGPMLTMEGDAVAEAVAVRGGRIAAVGGRDAVLALRGPKTEVTDLKGRALIPGFFASHAHFWLMAHFAGQVDLSPPPAGGVGSIGDLQAALRRALALRPAGADAPLLGWGYDDTAMAERRHPSRADLDAVSATVPILLTHISGHFVALNSAALARSGITAETADPPGGRVRRLPGGREPGSVLEENARSLVRGIDQAPPQPVRDGAYAATAQRLVALGYTTMVEHAAYPATLADLQRFAAAGNLPVDLVAYVRLADARVALPDWSPEYRSRLRVGGAKLIFDGSIQGYTGDLSRPYHRLRPEDPPDYHGYASVSPEEARLLVDRLTEAKVPFLTHVNGDAAIDLLLDAVDAAQARHGRAGPAPVLIHAQTLRADQIARARGQGVEASFFVDHVYFWGDRHREIFLGPERAPRISPARSAAQAGLGFSLHDDAPVVPADPIRTLWVAVNRTTSSGAALGADERLDTMAALRALTLAPARQQGEADQKGSIAVGKLADLAILSADPRALDPSRLRELKVDETIKEGRTLYWRGP